MAHRPSFDLLMMRNKRRERNEPHAYTRVVTAVRLKGELNRLIVRQEEVSSLGNLTACPMRICALAASPGSRCLARFVPRMEKAPVR